MKVKQSEDTEEWVPNEKQNKTPEKSSSETEKSN